MPETLADHLKLGGAAYEHGDLAAARTHFEKALALDPGANVARYNLGVVYRDLEMDQEAWVHFIDVLARDGRAAGAFNNLAILEERLGMYQAAEVHYRRALAIKDEFPDAHFNLGMLLLRLGQFPDGFRESEWRWKTSKFTPFRVPHPLWDGRPMRGTLLVHSEQGAGDAIQFVRYLPLAAERCDRLIFFCPVNLFSIFEGLPGVAELRGPGEVQVSEFQTYLPLLSLPLVLGTTLETIPCSIPYLTPQARTIDLGLPPVAVANPRLKVGIAWGGSATHQNDRHRSCRLRDCAPLFNLSDVAFYSLQMGPQAGELDEPGPWTGRLADLGARLSDYADTAAVLRQLDLLIAVDTSVVHLAGALGIPTWVMISSRSDWRWLIDREDTPWYPSLRLLRQSRLDDWREITENKLALTRQLGFVPSKGPSGGLRLDEDIVLGEVVVTLEATLDGFKGVLGDANAFGVGRLDQADDRVSPFPGHGPSPFDHSRDAVQ